MIVQDIVITDLIALLLVLWLLNLVRRGALHIGFALIVIGPLLGIVLTVSIPDLLTLATSLIDAAVPAFFLLAGGFVTFLFVYLLTQISILSKRLTALVQELALLQSNAGSEFDSTRHSHSR